MWDKLAEGTASTIDQFFTWKQTFFGPNSTKFPPCNVVRKERLAEESSNIASGEGGSERTLQEFGKKVLCPTHFGQDCSIQMTVDVFFVHGFGGNERSRGTQYTVEVHRVHSLCFGGGGFKREGEIVAFEGGLIEISR